MDEGRLLRSLLLVPQRTQLGCPHILFETRADLLRAARSRSLQRRLLLRGPEPHAQLECLLGGRQRRLGRRVLELGHTALTRVGPRVGGYAGSFELLGACRKRRLALLQLRAQTLRQARQLTELLLEGLSLGSLGRRSCLAPRRHRHVAPRAEGRRCGEPRVAVGHRVRPVRPCATGDRRASHEASGGIGGGLSGAIEIRTECVVPSAADKV